MPFLKYSLKDRFLYISAGYWRELINTDTEKSGCNGQRLCGLSGTGIGFPICGNTWEGTSGDLKMYGHPCAASGQWNEECIRNLCASSAKCGGFMKRDYTFTADYWFYDLSISVPGSTKNKEFKCWKFERYAKITSNSILEYEY